MCLVIQEYNPYVQVPFSHVVPARQAWQVECQKERFYKDIYKTSASGSDYVVRLICYAATVMGEAAYNLKLYVEDSTGVEFDPKKIKSRRDLNLYDVRLMDTLIEIYNKHINYHPKLNYVARAKEVIGRYRSCVDLDVLHNEFLSIISDPYINGEDEITTFQQRAEWLKQSTRHRPTAGHYINTKVLCPYFNFHGECRASKCSYANACYRCGSRNHGLVECSLIDKFCVRRQVIQNKNWNSRNSSGFRGGNNNNRFNSRNNNNFRGGRQYRGGRSRYSKFRSRNNNNFNDNNNSSNNKDTSNDNTAQ